MKYLKVWTDFVKVLAPLKDDETGRLFLAMLHYAATGEEPSGFPGNEAFLWAVAKRDIDTMSEKSETLRQNGLKGGRPKTKQNQTEANESNEKQTEPNESLKEKKRKEIKIKENKSSFLDDDDAREILSEQNRVLDAAEDAGFPKSNTVRARLLKLYADYGLEKVLSGLDSCAVHSAPNIAYLEACMSDRPKRAKGFDQRDYSNVPNDMMKDLAAEMAEFKKGAV